MTEEIIIAGFGGQGVLSMGKIMAYSGMMQDMEVSWMPSYGPEMRGGTANVNVILSDERISSPILRSFDTAIILNQQSMVYRIDAAEEASKMKMQKVFNMIVLGGFMKVKPILKTEYVLKGLKKSLPERYHNLIPLNEKAIERGMEIINKV